MSDYDQKAKNAVDMFAQGYSCAQSVFSVFSGDLGIPRDIALKLAAPFLGGMGRTGDTCGAVCGALMVLGYFHGNIEPDPKEKAKVAALTSDFLDEFTEIFGSIKCKDLLGYDQSKPDEYKIIMDKKLAQQKCPKFLKGAISILSKMK